MKNKANLLQNLALLVSVTVALLFISEFLVRAFFPFYNPATQIVFKRSENGPYLGPPNKTVPQRAPKGDYDLEVSFNRFGFRDDKDLTTAKDSDWFSLGDSFGLGWGVEQQDRFSDVLDSLAPYKVFNISIPTDILGYRRLLDYAESKGANVNNLLISICMENDLRDYATIMQPVTRKKTRKRKHLKTIAKTHSALFLFLTYELQKHTFTRNIVEGLGIAHKRDSNELLQKNRFNEQKLILTVNLLNDLIADRTAVILIIPSRALWIGDNRDQEAMTHTFLVNELRKKGIKVVDMRPAFEAGGNPMEYYFKNDPHWIPEGHKLAAEALYWQIQDLNK